MSKFLMSAALLAIAVPASAQVQAPVAPVAPQVDPGHTRDRAVAKVREHFARMDVNRDGFVAGDEMRTMRGQHQSGRQGMRRERAERMAERGGAGRDPSKAFDRIDANRDGMISRDEFGKARAMRTERKIAINRARGAAADGQHGMRKMHRMGGGHMGGRMMRMADFDRDGRVSLQEATTAALQHFDRVDANRDGRITPDERRQQREQRRALRSQRAG